MTAPPPVFNQTFLALTALIVAATMLALWWLLRRESRPTLLALALVTSLSLTVRLIAINDYPHGLNEDEPKVLYAAGRAVIRGTLLAESNISVPILHHALFHAQLIPILGVGRWTIRAYDFICGVLATPAAFAVARALGLRVASSLLVGGLIAVLPWSMFYSRVMQGASLTFYELLLLAVLARLIWQRGGWREALIGGGALGWLLYGYWCTRAMLPMPLLAAVLARGWRARLWCVAILLVGLALYRPYVEANRNSPFISQGMINPARFANPEELAALAQRGIETINAFVAPEAQDGWLTVRAGAMHPWLVLAMAAVGSLVGLRRALFLWGGFLLGLVPTVLAWGPPSTHRMLMAFPFIGLAAGSAVDLLRPAVVRHAAVVTAVLAVGWLSINFYFSNGFWRTETHWLFDWHRTELVQSLPLPATGPVVMMEQVGYFRDPRKLVAPNDQDLSVDNWLPGEQGGTYAFATEALGLRPLYEHVLGPTRVQAYGGTFTVVFEPRDWSFLRQHGWSYTARCDQTVRTALVPALYHPPLTFAGFACDRASEHLWRGKWVGPATTLRLRTKSPSVLRTRRGEIVGQQIGDFHVLNVEVEPGDELTAATTVQGFHPTVYATLTELDPLGERVPLWEYVVPIASPPVDGSRPAAAS
jgi:hypothetical protein